jgi:DNA mismatch repair protein MutS
MQNSTPMLRQYLEIKKQYPGTILFFRLGDFYEMFNEDAITGARELQITLTARQKDSANPIPMCGVPHHAAANYIAKLVSRGYRVAICEQAEPAGKGTKLVKREVVRVITPGTAIDEQLIEGAAPAYLSAVYNAGAAVAAAFLDVSTGEFFATQFDGPDAWPRIAETLERYGAKEVVVPDGNIESYRADLGFDSRETVLHFEQPSNDAQSPLDSKGRLLTPVEAAAFDPADASEVLQRQFGVRELTAFGLDGRDAAIAAAGACLRYARDTQRAAAEHIRSISYEEPADHMVLDAVTLRNLAILKGQAEDQKRSLADVIDATVTVMGSRLLRSWLLRPSIKRSEIETRLAAVTELIDPIFRDKIRYLLKNVLDIERLVGKLNLATITPRDLVALNASLEQTPKINQPCRT